LLLGLCHTQDAQKWLALHQLLESLRTEAGRGTLPNLAIVGVEGTSVKLRISKCDVDIDAFWKGKNPVGRSREFATQVAQMGITFDDQGGLNRLMIFDTSSQGVPHALWNDAILDQVADEMQLDEEVEEHYTAASTRTVARHFHDTGMLELTKKMATIRQAYVRDKKLGLFDQLIQKLMRDLGKLLSVRPEAPADRIDHMIVDAAAEFVQYFKKSRKTQDQYVLNVLVAALLSADVSKREFAKRLGIDRHGLPAPLSETTPPLLAQIQKADSDVDSDYEDDEEEEESDRSDSSSESASDEDHQVHEVLPSEDEDSDVDHEPVVELIPVPAEITSKQKKELACLIHKMLRVQPKVLLLRGVHAHAL